MQATPGSIIWLLVLWYGGMDPPRNIIHLNNQRSFAGLVSSNSSNRKVWSKQVPHSQKTRLVFFDVLDCSTDSKFIKLCNCDFYCENFRCKHIHQTSNIDWATEFLWKATQNNVKMNWRKLAVQTKVLIIIRDIMAEFTLITFNRVIQYRATTM